MPTNPLSGVYVTPVLVKATVPPWVLGVLTAVMVSPVDEPEAPVSFVSKH